MKEKRWEVLLSVEISGERDGTIWLGEGGNETLVIHSRRTAFILRREALRALKAVDQKIEHTERATTVTAREMRVIAVYQQVELYRWEVEHKMTMYPRKTILVKGGDHNSQVGGSTQRDGESGK